MTLADQLDFPLDPGPEAAVARRLSDLHQMLYSRGGIRPVNAAVEELSKLLLLRIAGRRFGDFIVEGFGPLEKVLDPIRIRQEDSVEGVKAAFSNVISFESFAGRLPDGSRQPVWPLDEPLRITRADVVAQALDVLEHIEVGAHHAATLDPLGTAFDVFLQGKYDHAGGLGTYLTPEPIATVMAQIALALVDPLKERGRIVFGDPCCGTGRFMVALLEQLRRQGRDESALEAFATNGVFGADQSSSAVAKATVNLLSYGLSHPHVFTVGDSITDPAIDRMTGSLQLILTNPPFGEAKYDNPQGVERTTQMLPAAGGRPKIDPAIAFLARCLSLLDDGGVLGIVLPDGVIDGSVLRDVVFGCDARRIDFSVEANVSLPTATFSLAGTVAKTSALFLRRGKSRRKTVFLARAEHVGYLKKGGARACDPDGNDMPIIGSFAQRLQQSEMVVETTILSSVPLVVQVARSDLISLDPNRLDPAAITAQDELRAVGGLTLGSFLTPVKKRRKQSLANVPFISVLHVDELSCVNWPEAETYRPTTPGIVAHPGEVIVSLLNPSKMRATVIPDRYGPLYCSAEFGVFTSSEDPYGILALLQDQRVRSQLAPLGRGTSSSRRRIVPADICDLLVPAVGKEWLIERGDTIKLAMDQIDQSKRQLSEAYTPS